MGVKPGYKQTEVGVIPENWEVNSFQAVASIERGRFSARPRNDPRYYGGDIPFIQTGDVTNSAGLIKTYSQTLSREGLTVSKVFRRGTIFFTIAANIGDVGFADFDTACPDSLVAITPAKGIDGRWLAHELRRRKPAFEKLATHNAQLNINLEKLRPYLLPVPAPSEQQAIAEALGDADALIESLEQLLAKKRQIKQGAMQELLSGKRRLPGFRGEWRTRQLGEVVDHCSAGATPYRGRPDYYKGKVKWITSGELSYNVITDTIEHISEEAVRKANLRVHPAGTFLMAITGMEAAGTRGACGIVGSPSTTNQSCMAIYPTQELRTAFLYHYYVLRGSDLAVRYCQGTKQQSYTAKLVKLLPIELPPTPEEQTAIASVLSDMDAEIAALESKLAKARQIKQGIMQELLTGRIRLI